VIGKIGTDIEDNKCSWLVVQALGKASEEQKKILEVGWVRYHEVAELVITARLSRRCGLG
jgi:farnesyl diphosphate synthase